MKQYITWKRGESTTSTGESITLTITFTSFNAKEIDRLEKLFRENIKTMLMVDETVTDENSIMKNNRNALYQYEGDRCYHCRYFNGEKKSIGVACTNPNKKWRSRTGMYHVPSVKACKMFERREDESHISD